MLHSTASLPIFVPADITSKHVIPLQCEWRLCVWALCVPSRWSLPVHVFLGMLTASGRHSLTVTNRKTGYALLPADLATLLIVFALLVLDRVAYTLGSPLLKAALHTG